jgi:hypothetical protein
VNVFSKNASFFLILFRNDSDNIVLDLKHAAQNVDELFYLLRHFRILLSQHTNSSAAESWEY